MKYKIKITNIQPPTAKSVIYKSKCIIGVSLNNPFFFNPTKVYLMLQWIDKRFPECMILIGDYLHRINEVIINGSDTETAILKAIEAGDELETIFQQNMSSFKNCRFHIHRWMQYKENAECNQVQNALFAYLHDQGDFRSLIQQSSEEFVKRLSKRGIKTAVDYSEALLLSTRYLIEEMAVFSYLIQKGYTVHLYPGTQLEILKQFANGLFPDIETNLDKGIYVDLRLTKK